MAAARALALATMAATADPFFTDDLLGIAKIMGVIVIPIIGAVWTLMRGGLQRKDSELENGINGVGKRANLLEERAVKLETWRGEVELRIGRHEDLISDLREGFGKVAATGDALRREIGEMRAGIAAHIAQEGEKNREQIHQVELQVAKLVARKAPGDLP